MTAEEAQRQKFQIMLDALRRYREQSPRPDDDRRADLSDAVGERAVLERIENEWWEDTGRPALQAAYPNER